MSGFAPVALILAVTLLRDGLPSAIALSRITDWSSDGLDRLSRDPFASSQFLLNVLLFVPAGLGWTWFTRRPLKVLAGLIALTVVIECIQAVTGVGAPDVADLVANSLGAAVGVCIVSLGEAVFRPKGSDRQKWSKQSKALAGLAGVVCLGLMIAGLFIGASHRQRTVADHLRHRFAGTTKDDTDPLLADPGSAEQLFSAISVRSDGQHLTGESLVLRWPATFFSLHRCVFVTWTKTSVTFDKGSGDECTVFMD